ncbi:MAG: arginine--tRNA ligase [Kiloniellales bacterium]
MNLFRHFHDRIVAELGALAAAGTLPAGLDFARVTVEPPRDASHGDLSTNAAMVLAKPAGLKPRDLAEALRARLAGWPEVTAAEVAGPGFLNLRLGDSFWQSQLAEVLLAGTSYGDSDIGAGQRVNVEYVSANPTGPLTVGHARGAVVGDALAALLEKAGYAVTREYYINDAGGQVDNLAFTAYWRYLQALGSSVTEETMAAFISAEELQYLGDYLKAVGRALVEKYGDSLATPTDGDWDGRAIDEWLPIVRDFTVAAMMEQIRADLKVLGIEQDIFTSERALVESGGVDQVLKVLEARGLVYTGTLDPPKGKTPEDWEPRPQLLFRATLFGDDVDRPLKKSDGSFTYFANDMMNHLDKHRRGAELMIDIWGADHGGYVKRMKAAVTALTEGKGRLEVLICQLVKLLRGGEPVKLSKRAGEFVTLRELVEEVGRGVVRFIMLTRKNDAPLDFDLEKVVEQSRDNPVFYVQYAHARCCSVLRLAAEEVPDIALDAKSLASGPLNLLTDDGELGLIKQLASWPRLVESAAEAYEPHRVAFYLYELAAAFHGLWTKGKEEARLRFILPDEAELTAARLALVQAVAFVVASGLEVFGIEPLEEMR